MFCTVTWIAPESTQPNPLFSRAALFWEALTTRAERTACKFCAKLLKERDTCIPLETRIICDALGRRIPNIPTGFLLRDNAAILEPKTVVLRCKPRAALPSLFLLANGNARR